MMQPRFAIKHHASAQIVHVHMSLQSAEGPDLEKVVVSMRGKRIEHVEKEQMSVLVQRKSASQTEENALSTWKITKRISESLMKTSRAPWPIGRSLVHDCGLKRIYVETTSQKGPFDLCQLLPKFHQFGSEKRYGQWASSLYFSEVYTFITNC